MFNKQSTNVLLLPLSQPLIWLQLGVEVVLLSADLLLALAVDSPN